MTRTFIAVAVLVCAHVTCAAPPSDLDSYVQRSMRAFDIPGAAIAIVEPGRPAHARGYGVRKLGAAERVNERTLFAIASNTKAFTATALAILTDEGALAWDDRVVDRLPGFRMYDAYATHEMTLRDLLVHRSGLGLGAGDLLFWPGTTFTREQIVERLRFIAPATSFRSGYAYDNILYVVVGRVIEEASGQSWESFVEKRILAPLQMSDSVTSFAAVRTPNRAWPHARLGDRMRGVGTVQPLRAVPALDNSAPAGAIHSSASDMARWLQLRLDGGRFGDRRLFSEAAAVEMWKPHTLMPIEPAPPPIEITTSNFQTYALGSVVRDYRGHKIILHQGYVEGAISISVLLPDTRVGFIIMMNAEDDEAYWAITWHLLDHYLKLPPRDWIVAYEQTRKQKLADALRKLDAAAARATTDPARGPSLAIERYAGVYRDVWYGTVTISAQASGLTISFGHSPGMQGALEHVRNDTFRTRFGDRRFEDALVTFSLRADGSIDAAKLEAVSPLADFSFDYQDLLLKPSGRCDRPADSAQCSAAR